MGPNQVLPLGLRVDLGVMAMEGYSAFPKAPALMEPHHQVVYSVISRALVVRILPLSRDAVGVFYNCSRLDFAKFKLNLTFVQIFIGSFLLKIRIYTVYTKF